MKDERRVAPFRENVRYAAVVIASTFLMGSSFVAGKILLKSGIPSLVLVGWRFLLAAAATLPVVALWRDDGDRRLKVALMPSLSARQWAFVAVIGFLQTGAVMGLLFLAMQSISAPVAAILLFTNPIWVALLGVPALGESLSAQRGAGLVLGVGGVVLAMDVGTNDALGDPKSGDWMALGSAVCWAVATIVNKRERLPMSPWVLSFWQMLLGSAVLLAVACARGEHWPETTTWKQWGWFLWLAIPASTGSFGLWFVALRLGGATRASSYLFLAPLFAVLLSSVVLRARLSWFQAAGGVSVAGGLWLVNRHGGGWRALHCSEPDGAVSGLSDPLGPRKSG